MPGIKYITRVLRGVRFEKLNYVMGVVKQKSGHSKARTFCDILWCAARYGAGYYDYVMFGFYDMNGKQRDTYLTRVRNKKVCELMNQPGYGDEFDDKLRFNVRFADFLGRRTLNAAAATPDELVRIPAGARLLLRQAEPRHLRQRHREAPHGGLAGCGEAAGLSEGKGPRRAGGAACAASGYGEAAPAIRQHHAHRHGPCRRHRTHCLYCAEDRQGDGFCDNSGQGGVICRVDEKTGKICSVATDDYFNVYETHPDTGIRFEGYQLPMVQEAVAFARKAALVVPQICHVGWDVAVTPDGPVLIEGNDYPGTDLCQLAPHYPEKQASGRITRKF